MLTLNYLARPVLLNGLLFVLLRVHPRRVGEQVTLRVENLLTESAFD